MNEKISIIMPACNVENYIAKSIKSVMAQTYQNWELVIVDDGSTDETSQIIAEYVARDKRIRVITQKNGGVSVARNSGIDVSTGKYICFLDADDLYDKNHLQILYQKMKSSPNNHFVYGKTESRSDDGERYLIGESRIIEGYIESFIIKNKTKIPFHISGIMLDKSTIKKYSIKFIPKVRITEDIAFFLELLSVIEAKGITNIVSYYTNRNDSATKKEWLASVWCDQIRIYDAINDFVKNKRPIAWKKYCALRGHVAYDFICDCLRHNDITSASSATEKWESYLKDFMVNKNEKFMRRLKCKYFLKFYKNLTSMKLMKYL